MAKHSTYFRKPKRFMIDNDYLSVKKYKGINNLPGDCLFETPRSNYINNNLEYSGKKVLDIGCNTGFFLFNALDQGAESVVGYEGSKSALEILLEYSKDQGDVTIKDEYFDFKTLSDVFDITHCLNVVHHLGDDYGDQNISISEAKLSILKQIDYLGNISDRLVFQMGYNWKGDVNFPLFKSGEKREMIDFIRSGLKNWAVERVSVAELHDDVVVYSDLDSENLRRYDALGEFLNRPIFIMKSIAM